MLGTGVPVAALKDIARTVRADHQQPTRTPRQSMSGVLAGAALLAVVDGSNLAWARTTEDGRPCLCNVHLVGTALAVRGYQALVVVAALRDQLGQSDAWELDRRIAAPEVIRAPAATDGDLWVIRTAHHHGAPARCSTRSILSLRSGCKYTRPKCRSMSGE
jgi:hypothetical protein